MVQDHYSNTCIILQILRSGHIQCSLWLHEEIPFKLIIWKSVFTEMLKVTWQVKKFPTPSSYKTQKYTIGLFPNPLQMAPNLTLYFLRYIFILYSHLYLVPPSGFLVSGFQTTILYKFLTPLMHAACVILLNLIILMLISNICYNMYVVASEWERKFNVQVEQQVPAVLYNL